MSRCLAFWNGVARPAGNLEYRTDYSEDQKKTEIAEAIGELVQGELLIIIMSAAGSPPPSRTGENEGEEIPSFVSSHSSRGKGKVVLISNTVENPTSTWSPTSIRLGCAEICLSCPEEETVMKQHTSVDSAVSGFVKTRETSISHLVFLLKRELAAMGVPMRKNMTVACCLPSSDAFVETQTGSALEPSIFDTVACVEGSEQGEKLSVDFRKNVRHFAPGDRALTLQRFESQQVASHVASASSEAPLLVTMAVSSSFISEDGRMALRVTAGSQVSPPVALLIGVEASAIPAIDLAAEEGVFSAIWREVEAGTRSPLGLTNGWLQIIQQLGKGVPLPFALGSLGIPCRFPLVHCTVFFNPGGLKFSGRRLGKYMDQNWGCVTKPELLGGGEGLEKAVRQGLGKALDLDDWLEISKVEKETLPHFVRDDWVEAFHERLMRFGGERMTLRKFMWLLREGGNKPDLDNISPDVSCQQQ